jgi:phenylalanyl-tRNA synthetase beta chain
MKISYNWLKRYLEIELTPDKVADFLTGCGLEVESIDSFESVKGGLKGVVIGEVLTCEKHPNSDHLSVTTVNTGTPESLHIVCGASNVAAGQKVAVAGIGATLYFNDKELTIQRTKIRGEVSEGMICAEDELGLGKSHAGIMVLAPEAVPGTPAREYFNIVQDWVFTIGLTPNRVDAASHIGVARDLAAVIHHSGRDERLTGIRQMLKMPDVSHFATDNATHPVKITIENPEACGRYCGLTISGLTVKESPDWLKNLLLAVGLRPINNIVDITNFVLMETGQPLHSFDLAKVDGNQVIVKKIPDGTRFITLDGTERGLTGNDLMICNANGPMCIGGIFGGAGSGVTDATTSVFLESAWFDPQHIRRSSKHHGLQTDASFRFERGADPDIAVYALKRAALLMKEIAGGIVSAPIEDICPNPFPVQQVDLIFSNLDRLAGKSLNPGVVEDILSDLGFVVLERLEPKPGLRLKVPAYKVDVTREADVIEEVLRIYGYNNIEIHDELRASLSFTVKPDPEEVMNVVADYLSSNGFHEIMNNSLTRSAYYENNPVFPAEKAVKILNPLSRDLDVMRQTLLYGGLETIVYNQNRKIPDLRLYEFGTVYSVAAKGESTDPLPGFHEENHLSLFITGRNLPENWNIVTENAGFYTLKSHIEGVLTRLGINLDVFDVQPVSDVCIAEGLKYAVKGVDVFRLGEVSKSLLKELDCRQPVWYAEVNWTSLFKLVPVKESRYRELPRFPEVRRDLALLVDKAITFDQIETVAHQTEKSLLKKVGLFDVYEGDKIASGKKSYAVSFILQDEEKTLTDKEIDKVMGRLIKALTEKVNAQIR